MTKLIRSLIVFCLLFFVSIANATNYYVSPSPTGSNSNSGTRTSPYLTCDYAASKATSPGDNVIFMDGTHSSSSGTYYCDIYSQGTAANPIVFRAENPGMAVIDGQYSASRPYGFILWAGAKHITIKDLEIKRFTQIGVRGNGSRNSDNPIFSENIILQNLYIHNIADNAVVSCTDSFGRAGIFTDQYTRNYTVDQCKIHTVGRVYNTACYDSKGYLISGYISQTAHDQGWYMQGAEHTLKNSIIYDCYAGWAVKLDGHCGRKVDGSDDLASGTWTAKLSNNTFGFGTNPGGSSGNITFVNNGTTVCYTGPKYLIPPHDVIIENNIFHDPPGRGTVAAIRFYYSNYFTNNVLRNNITDAPNLYYFHNTSMGADTSTIKTNSNNVLNYPTASFFVDIASMADPNFTPIAGFYGIDRGYNNGLTYDIDGNTRPYGSGIDMGAYEVVDDSAPVVPIYSPAKLKISSGGRTWTFGAGVTMEIVP